MCRQGVSVIQSKVLDVLKDNSLRVIVVWVPMLPTDKDAPDQDTLALMPDKRATQFWDAKRSTPFPVGRALGLPEGFAAWDVYLLYPPGAKFEQQMPKPVYWQHQLPVKTAPRLNGNSFAAEVRKVLK